MGLPHKFVQNDLWRLVENMLKKLWVNRVGIVVVLLCTYLLVFGFVKTYDMPQAVMPVSAGIDGNPVIVLDAGHGGIDSGCVSVNGAEEKDINLSILLKLRDILKTAGFEVVVTRDTDTSIHDTSVTGLGNQKKSDMENRLKIINSQDNAVFVSIHQNRFTDPQYYGAQMFYSAESEESAKLASIMQASFVNFLQPENTRETKPVGKELYLIHFAKCPSVMVECGFLSNPDEAALLESEEYQAKVAFTIFAGLCEYICPADNP